MKHILIDCDNTMGLARCDIDDALAILYLLGHPKAHCVGITTTYGNSTTDNVYDCTQKLLRDLSIKDVPVVKGEDGPTARDSQAGVFLNEQADLYEGDLCILATGSVTNLLSAYEQDEKFFDKVSEIVLMGGITEPLLVNGKPMDELNFSCDPKAAEAVMTKGRKVAVITGNHCTDAYFFKKDFERLCRKNPAMGRYLHKQTAYWFSWYEEHYGVNGFIAWDVIAAIYMMEKDLFAVNEQFCQIKEEELRRGNIPLGAAFDRTICFPIMKDWESVKIEMINKWINIGGTSC